MLADQLAPLSKALGDLVIFPSYLPHAVMPVTKGIRFSLVLWIRGQSADREPARVAARRAEALAAHAASSKARPEVAALWVMHAERQAQYGEHQRAIHSFERAVELYDEQDVQEMALSEQELKRQRATVFYNYASSLRETGGGKQAMAAFMRAAKTDPLLVMAHVQISMLAWSAGQTRLALKTANQARASHEAAATAGLPAEAGLVKSVARLRCALLDELERKGERHKEDGVC